MEYMQRVHPSIANVPTTGTYRPNRDFNRKVASIMRFWDIFAQTSSIGTELPPSISDIIGFMYYRVGGGDPSLDLDSGSGTVCLSTFLETNVSCLISGLRNRYGDSFTMSVKDLVTNRHYKNSITDVKEQFGENLNFCVANPIWESDEARLMLAASSDTVGLKDRTIIRILTRSGARMGSISQIRIPRDVMTAVDVNGIPYIQLAIPSIKTRRGVRFTCTVSALDSEAFNDLQRWVARREVILKNSPFLFCTMQGDYLPTDTVTKMLARLSELAGYGDGFFSSHSGRHGFCSRRIALEYSQGNGAATAHDGLAGTGHWEHNSTSIHRYCETEVRKFFYPPHSKTWEEFQSMTPEELHNLTPLGPIKRRANGCFSHDEEIVREVGAMIGCPAFPEGLEQWRKRSRISSRLSGFDPDFNRFVSSLGMSSKRSCALSITNLLFEMDLMKSGFKFRLLSAEVTEILRATYQVSISARDIVVPSVQPVRNVRLLRHHRVETLDDARRLQQRLLRRTRDRQVNTVDVRQTGGEYLATYPAREGNAHETNVLPRIPMAQLVLEEDDLEDVLPPGEPMQVHTDSSGAMYVIPIGLPLSVAEEPIWVGSDNEDSVVIIASPVSRQASRVLQTPSTVASAGSKKRKH